MSDPLLITVAPTGAETAKEDCPQLPTTLEELAETAQECEAAGAAMIHVHIRDDDHRPTLDLGLLKESVAARPRGHRPGRPAVHRRQRPRSRSTSASRCSTPSPTRAA